MADNDAWSVRSPLGRAPACSDWARSQHLDPVGSAGHYAGFLLVEQPLPWPSDISSMPELVEVANLATSAGFRLQAVVPAARNEGALSAPDDEVGSLDMEEANALTETTRRLICYRSTRPGWAGPLARYESRATRTGLAEAAAALVGEDDSRMGPGGAGPDVVDILVCTHGRRDACCGSRGIELLADVARAPAISAAVRTWRTSHTGGHRFAPTVIVLPTGTMWAWTDARLLGGVVLGEGSIAEYLGHYRGCASVGSPSQQAVERAVLAEVGWALLSSFRRASDLGGGVIRLETELGSTWEAVVREGRRVPQPDCRTSPDLATRQSVEWVVEGLRQVVPA